MNIYYVVCVCKNIYYEILIKMLFTRLNTFMKCEYGCDNDAVYTTKTGKHICNVSHNQCPANKAKNSKGLKHAYKTGIKAICKNLESMREKSIEVKKLAAKNRFDSGKSDHMSNLAIKRILLDNYDRGNRCERCNITDWHGAPIVFELDHIDGDNFNNSVDNLRFLCPNCHSQTKTFRGRNINSGKKKVPDEELIEALKNTNNIRQALISVKLSPRGANYIRASKLLTKLVAEVGFEPTLNEA